MKGILYKSLKLCALFFVITSCIYEPDKKSKDKQITQGGQYNNSESSSIDNKLDDISELNSNSPKDDSVLFLDIIKLEDYHSIISKYNFQTQEAKDSFCEKVFSRALMGDSLAIEAHFILAPRLDASLSDLYSGPKSKPAAIFVKQTNYCLQRALKDSVYKDYVENSLFSTELDVGDILRYKTKFLEKYSRKNKLSSEEKYILKTTYENMISSYEDLSGESYVEKSTDTIYWGGGW